MARLQERAKARISFEWDIQVSEALLSAGRRQPLSTYVLLLAAFKIVLARYSGQEDIVVLSPVYSEEEQPYNHAVAFRDEVNGTTTFRELAGRVKQTVADGYKHQHYPLDVLAESLAPADPDAWYRVALSFDSLHGAEATGNIAGRPGNRLALRFSLEGGRLGGTVDFDAKRYLPDTAASMVECLGHVLTQVLANPDLGMAELDWVPPKDLSRLFGGSDATQAASYPAEKTIHACFEAQAARTPDRVAVVCEDRSVTYRELNRYANRIAAFLRDETGVEADVPVGILMERSVDMIAAALGVLKAGGAYVPLDPAYPEERLRMMIEDARIPVVISMSSRIKLLNRLQWECADLHTFLCLDVEYAGLAEEEEHNELMNSKLWEHVGRQAEDDITGGAWTNSYTGAAFSSEEMDEYGENILTKLRPYLHAGARVLEIGCATGLSMYRIAPHVHSYVGTDLSSVIINKNEERVQREGIRNIFLHCLAADEIDRLQGMDFDIIIMNSVIQCFHGHNYLRRVMDKALKLLKDQGVVFIGDVMDLEAKPALVKSMLDYRSAHPDSRVKTDWSEELFVSRWFWDDLRSEFPSIREVSISAKLGSIVNELTLFRYDTLLTVDKRAAVAGQRPGKHKKQYGCSSLWDRSEENSPSAAGPRSLAYLIYTSGTTGRPKGVMIEHRNVVRLLMNDRMPFAFDERDVWTMFHSFSFDFSVWEMYGALLYGGQLVVVPKRTAQDPRAFAELLHRSGVTVLNQTPTAFYQLISHALASGGPLPQLRYVILGGEALKPSLLQSWRDKYPDVRLVNMYGITETTVHVSYLEVSDSDVAANSTRIGQPIPTLEAYVMDSKLRLLPLGAVGELCIGGEGVARGYLNREELTADKFVPNPYKAGERLYRSGDLARMRPDGTLEYAGRMDQQVKVRGYRIELGEIESRLCQHEAVREAAVVTAEDADGDKSLCAYYVPSATVSPSELRDFLEAQLPAHMVPSFFTELEALPVTTNGKLNRAGLPKPGFSPSTGQYTAPRDGMERVLAGIWEELLSVERLGIHDSFFELGAHSITMMKAIGRIEQQLHVELAFSELIEHPTVAQLAGRVAGKDRQEHAVKYPLQLPEPDAVHSPFPLTEVQTAYMAGRNAEYEMGGISTHFYVEISTRMDIERFNRSLNRVIRRHPMLRAIILPHGEQRILEHVPEYRIHTEDLSAMPADGREATLLRERERMSHDVRAPEVWPLFEFKAYRITADTHLLLVSFDVLIADAANLRQISRELLHYYHRPEEPLPELEFTFRDYMMAYKQLQQSPVYHRDRQFWLGKLEDFPPAPVLPMKPASRGGKPKFTRLSREFSQAEWERLKHAAREKRVTPSAMLCTGYAEVLAYWSNQPHLAVNMTVFNRYPFHPDVGHIVGDFTSILLLDLNLDPANPFWKQAAGVQRTMMEALEHRHYDGIEMIREIARHHKYPPGKAVMPFVFTSVIFDEGDPGDESWEDLGEMTYGISQTSQVYLDFQAIETDGRLLVNWDYAVDVLDAEMVRFMFDRYLALLSGLAEEEPDLSAVLQLAEPDALLLQAYNATEFPEDRPRTLQQLFVERARQSPERTAVMEEDRDWSYRELEELSNRVAGLLKEQGVGRGDRVALLAARETASIILALGILKTGAAYVPVDPRYPQERRDYIMDSTGCRLLLEPQMLEAAGAYPAAFEAAHHPGDPAYILFTSGSTGRPKGVVITHQAVCNTITDINRRFGVDENDRILAVSSMCFDLSVYDLFGAFHAGAAVVPVRDPSDLAEVVRTLFEKRITIWNSVPAIMELVTDYLEGGSKSSRMAVPSKEERDGDALAEGQRLAEGKRWRWAPSVNWKAVRGGIQIGSHWYAGTAAEVFPELYFLTQDGADTDEITAHFPEVDSSELRSLIGKLIRQRILVSGLQTPQELFAPQGRLFHHANGGDTLQEEGAYREFKKRQLNRMSAKTPLRSITLEPSGELPSLLTGRRSPARFDEDSVISFGSFSQLLSVLKQRVEGDRVVYCYASAGGLYPIDVYIYVKPGRVEQLNEGLYYYHPASSCLHQVIEGRVFSEEAHYPANREIHCSSAFTAFLVYNAEASMPRYGSSGYYYACIEAGMMAATLSHAAETEGLALCSIGELLDWNPQEAMQLTDRQILLHTLEGGLKPRPGTFGEKRGERVLQVEEGGALPSLRLVLLSGDWISVGLPGRISRKFPDAAAVSLGGATEASIWSIGYPIESPADGWRSIPYGRPLANQTIHVLNYRMKPCPVDVPGELYIGGMGLAQEYWQDEDKTNRAFIRHPELGRLYRTGDYGVMRRGGYVEFIGRRDQQVKIRGYRVEPGEIEACLLRHAAIRQALVVDRIDAHSRKSLCAYLVASSPASDPSLEAAGIRHFLQEHLPEYMVPEHLVFLNAIPLTPNGKIDRTALPAPEAEAERKVPYSPPNNEIEQKLAEIWQDLLKTTAVGRDDDFFTLGGTSLHTMSLIARVHEHFEVELPLQQIFSAPTLKHLSDYLFRVLAGDDSLTHAEDAFTQLHAGPRGNLFVFPPVGGYGIVYKALSHLLEDYSTYSFNYLEDSGFIERYADQVERIQPQGPIVTMGYSSGGTLAYEVAKTLIARGREVSQVILIDSARRVAPSYFSEAQLRERAEETMAHIEQDPQFRDYLTNGFVKRVILRRIQSYLGYFFNELISSGPIETQVHLIEATDTNREATGPWAEASGRTFHVYAGHGTHNHMLSQGHVQLNSELIRRILQKPEDG
ncbi:amino acid adenylation domain-containing protein [Paenibacillus mucilaginosus]|nr:amino acid adenylation domain-containing protein [Paenibacillus mucilaginosus]